MTHTVWLNQVDDTEEYRKRLADWMEQLGIDHGRIPQDAEVEAEVDAGGMVRRVSWYEWEREPTAEDFEDGGPPRVQRSRRVDVSSRTLPRRASNA